MAKTFNEMNEKELGKVFQDQLGDLDQGGIEEVASQLGEDRDFLQDELKAIKELASGNKLLNAVQIADAYTRRNLDAKLEKNFEDIQRDQRDLSKNIAGGKQGRVDIRRDIAQAEANLTQEIRKNGGGGSRLGQTTQKILVDDGRRIRPATEEELGRTARGQDVEAVTPAQEQVNDLANEIKFPTRFGREAVAGSGMKGLVSFGESMTTEVDGKRFADAKKIEDLQNVLKNSDEGTEEKFTRYMDLLRKQSLGGQTPRDREEKKMLSKELRGVEGLSDVVGKDTFKDTTWWHGRQAKKFAGIDQGSWNPLQMGRIRNWTKEGGIIQTMAGTSKRRDFQEPAERENFESAMKGLTRDVSANEAKRERDKIREEGGILNAYNSSSSMGGGLGGKGLSVEENVEEEQLEVLKDIREAVENQPSSSTMGGLFSGLGVTLAAAIATALAAWGLFNYGRNSFDDSLMPSAAKLGTKAATTSLKLGTKVVTGVAKPVVSTVKAAMDVGKNIALRTATNPATAKLVPKFAENLLNRSLTKEAAEMTAKATGKSVTKKIPGLGTLLSLGFAGWRSLQGDFSGAGLEIASGALSLGGDAAALTGVGAPVTVAAKTGALAVDGGLLYRDIQRMGVDYAKSLGIYDENLFSKDTVDSDLLGAYLTHAEVRPEDKKKLLDSLLWDEGTSKEQFKMLQDLRNLDDFTKADIERIITPTAEAIENTGESLDSAVSALSQINQNIINNNDSSDKIAMAVLPPSVVPTNKPWQLTVKNTGMWALS